MRKLIIAAVVLMVSASVGVAVDAATQSHRVDTVSMFISHMSNSVL